MAWYYGEFSCGHEGRVNIIGPHKDREWKKERAFSKQCPECWEKQIEEEREKANKEAEEKAKEMELPELVGSEKQVSWANTLRQKFIDTFEQLAIECKSSGERKHYNRFLETSRKIESSEDILMIMNYVLENKKSATYYIDNRNEIPLDIIKSEIDEALKDEKEKAEEEYQKQLIEREKIESTIYPENKETDTVAEIVIGEDFVKVFFEKDRDFIKLVKDLGYRWNGVWKRDISYTNGSVTDRAVELANKLLSEGYPVTVPTKEIKEKAIKGEFESECTRWIYARVEGKYKGYLSIRWNGYNNDLYNVARKLPGSRWDSAVMVKPNYYKEVEEFAELYEFNFTDSAIELIEEYKEIEKDIELVEVVKVESREEKDGLKEILESEVGILDDLKD